MGSPRYELASLKALASLDCMISGGDSCKERLKVLFDGPGAAKRIRQFCKFMVAQLQPSDFCRTAEDMYCGLTGEEPFAYDIYALEVEPQRLCEQGIEQVDGRWPTTWYMKLAVVTFEGRKVHLLSLHCLEARITRADGSVLVQGWDDGYRND